MKRNRRLVPALVSVLLFAACSGSSTPPAGSAAGTTPAASTAAGSGTPNGAPVEITFQSDPDAITPVAFWQDLVDKFNAKNPGIHVKFIPSPGATQRDQYAKTLLQSGAFPDTAWALSVDLFKDNLLPFDQNDPVIKQQLKIDTMTWGGQLLNLSPFEETWSSIYYNKKMFAAAGITDPPKTWPEFETVLQKLKDSGVTPLMLGGEFIPGFYMAAALSNVFSETDPCWYSGRRAGTAHFVDQIWVDEATKLQDWAKKNYFLAGGLGNSYVQTGAAFLQGKAAMYPMGDFESGNFKNNPPKDFEIGYFATPSSDGLLHLAGPLGGHGYTVSKTSTHPAEALTFAKWMGFDPEAVDPLLSVYGLAPQIKLTSGTLNPTYTPLQQAIVDDVNKAAEAPNTLRIGYFGQGDKCGIVPGMNDEIAKQASAIILGGDVKASLAKLDTFWDANVGK
jgi:ABC-type glycerol-3-phosphate transport system substrate-binding protein